MKHTKMTRVVALVVIAFSTGCAATLLPHECSGDIRWLDNREHCQKASKWSPRSVLWDHFVQNNQEPLFDGVGDGDGEDQRDEIAQCLDEAMSSYRLLRELNAIDVKPASGKPDSRKHSYEIAPHVVNEYRDPNTNKILAMEIADAMSEEMAYAIKSLAGCSRKFLPDILFEHRPFTSGGGNDCTFIQTLAQIFLPGVPAHVQKIAEFVYETAGWNGDSELPPPGTLGMRTMEHLNYGAFPKGLGSHADQGSIYTVLFSLTDPNHYEGGTYYIEMYGNDGEKTYTRFKPEKYSAMVFLSETLHGVDPIPSGHREMFTNEFWPLYDVAFPLNRPDEDDFEVYTDWVQKAVEKGEDPREVPWPELEETDAWLAERNRSRVNDVDYGDEDEGEDETEWEGEEWDDDASEAWEEMTQEGQQ